MHREHDKNVHIQDPNHPKRNSSYLHHTVHEDFDKEMAGSVVDTAAIHGLREEMELEFAIFKEQVHTHGSVNGELRLNQNWSL